MGILGSMLKMLSGRRMAPYDSISGTTHDGSHSDPSLSLPNHANTASASLGSASPESNSNGISSSSSSSGSGSSSTGGNDRHSKNRRGGRRRNKSYTHVHAKAAECSASGYVEDMDITQTSFLAVSQSSSSSACSSTMTLTSSLSASSQQHNSKASRNSARAMGIGTGMGLPRNPSVATHTGIISDSSSSSSSSNSSVTSSDAESDDSEQSDHLAMHSLLAMTTSASNIYGGTSSSSSSSSGNSSSAASSLSKTGFIRPSKRRQEDSDLTTDIEATVMAMDIDKDPSSSSSSSSSQETAAESELVHHGDDYGGTMATTVTTIMDKKEDGAISISATSSVTTTKTAAAATIATYPLVNNRLFDIPEIIRSIAEFLDKPSLAASCRVSQIWAQHCTPLLWKHVVDKHWRDGTFYASIRKQAQFIRTIKCEDKTDYEEMLLCDLPRLKAMSLHGSREAMAVKDKVLYKVASSLVSLVLSAVAETLSNDTVLAVRNLKQLTVLKLLSVNLQRIHLAEILRDCKSLEFLSISRVQLWTTGFGSPEQQQQQQDLADGFWDITGTAASSSGLGLEDDNSADTVVQGRRTRIRYLALKEISIEPLYLIQLIKSCPDLLELSLARNENMTFSTELIKTMQVSCSRLYALDVGSCKQLDRETFQALFTSITQLTIINLSGTRIADEELLLLAQNCKRVSRLDIQYCTAITSLGLHQFLSQCGESLRHLEASGVTIEPDSFDRHQHWTCRNLQILFVHIGLVGSIAPSKMFSTTTTAAMTVASTSTETEVMSQGGARRIGVGDSSESCSSMMAAVDAVANEKKRSQDGVTLSSKYPGERSISHDDSGSGSGGSGSSLSPTGAAQEEDEEVTMTHPLHPIQEVSNVQYLGLMGCGAKLTQSTQNPLIHGFRSVKRLHVLGLYQSFKKEDLSWLVKSLPELCRIDAEKYNVSDELLKWFEEMYPDVQICRQE
ncbi:hypothetical protein EDD11_007412 [Mortierella claussenii]|nr:hypothetical protein EDD11_007412 [Mortierella claussenii]